MIKVYGADWCGDTLRSNAFLTDIGVPFEYFNVDTDPAAAQEVIDLTGEARPIPVIVLNNGDLIREPSDPQLAAALMRDGALEN